MGFKTITGGRVISAMLLTATLGACGGAGVPARDEIPRIADTPIQQRNADINRSAQEAMNFLSEPPVTVLETSGSTVLQLKTDAGQKVPDVPVGEINAQPMEFGALLNQISEQVGMSWRILGPSKDDLLTKKVYYVQRSETTLATVLEELADLTNSFVKVEGDRIIFSQDQLFVLRVPRMADSQEILEEGLGNLGAEEIFSDKLSGTITFRATKPAYQAAKRLVDSFEMGRDMIVYDFWIIDREVNDNSSVSAGFGFTGDGGAFGFGNLTMADHVDGGTVTGNLGSLGVAAGVELFRKLGKTDTVARPTISMLSGGESSFNTTQKESYVGSMTETTTNSEENNGDEETKTELEAKTEEVEVGVKINVKGSHNANVISTDFDIEVSELIGFTDFDNGTRQPKTAERSVKAHLEARPGDVMVIGGIMRDRQSDSASELPGINMPHDRTRAAAKTETILLVRPRLVQIRPTRIEAPKAPLRVEAGVNELDLAENPIEAVMDDEQKARALLESLAD